MNHDTFQLPSGLKSGWGFFNLIWFMMTISIPVIAQELSPSNPDQISDFESRQPQPSEWINLFQEPTRKSEIDLSKHGQLTLNRMTSNGEGLLAFLDYADEQIVLFDATQNLDSARFIKIGHGIGNRLSQFGNTFDIKFLGKEELLVTDIMHSRITRWDVQGAFKESMAFDEIVPSRITICPDGTLYILLQNYDRKGMIARVNLKTRKVEKIFQRVNRFDLQSVFHRDGSMTCDDSELLYSAYYFDFLKRYTSGGDVAYSRTLTGFTPNEVLVEQGDNELGAYIRRSPEARRSVGEIFIFGGALFAGFSGNSDALMRRIDLYDPSSGFYLGTIPIEEPFEEFVIDLTGIYILTPPTEQKPPRIIQYIWDENKKIPRVEPDVRDHKTVSGKTSSKP